MGRAQQLCPFFLHSGRLNGPTQQIEIFGFISNSFVPWPFYNPIILVQRFALWISAKFFSKKIYHSDPILIGQWYSNTINGAISGVTSSISSLLVCVYGKVWFLQPSGLVVEDCKHVLLRGVCPPPMLHMRLFDIIVRARGYCSLQSLGWRGRLILVQSFAA